MNLTDEQTRLALYAVTDLIARRLIANRPVPPGFHRFRVELDASARGSEFDSAPAQLTGEELIDTAEAAALLHCSARWAREIASDLDGFSIGGRWFFSRKAVVEYAEMRGHENRTSND